MQKLRKGRHQLRGLTSIQETLLKASLRRSACSEPWVDDQIVVRHCPGPGGRMIPVRLHDPSVFPPGGRRRTPMRWCRSCGRYTPAPAIQLVEHRLHRGGAVVSATLECDDCRISHDFEQYQELYEAGLHLRPPSSRSYIGMAELRRRSVDRNQS